MKRLDLLNSSHYWLFKIQVKLFHELSEYMKINNLTKEQVADKFEVKVRVISQVLNCSFNGKIEKMVDLFLKMNRVAVVNTPPMIDYVNAEKEGRICPYETLFDHYFTQEVRDEYPEYIKKVTRFI